MKENKLNVLLQVSGLNFDNIFLKVWLRVAWGESYSRMHSFIMISIVRHIKTLMKIVFEVN